MPGAGFERGVRKIGTSGVVLASVCCLRIPIVLSALAALGLGFLLRGEILLPVMVLVLAAVLLGLHFEYAIHRRGWPLELGSVSAVALVLFAFALRIEIAVALALAGLIVSRIASVVFRRRCATGDGRLGPVAGGRVGARAGQSG
jgi:MerC mercury resistance protein